MDDAPSNIAETQPQPYPSTWFERKHQCWGRPFVFIPSAASRNERVVSILAIIETFIAVAIYWYLVNDSGDFFWVFNPSFLWLALLATPLLLLRSQPSIALGLKLFLAAPLNLEHIAQWSRNKYLAIGSILLIVGFSMGASVFYAVFINGISVGVPDSDTEIKVLGLLTLMLVPPCVIVLMLVPLPAVAVAEVVAVAVAVELKIAIGLKIAIAVMLALVFMLVVEVMALALSIMAVAMKDLGVVRERVRVLDLITRLPMALIIVLVFQALVCRISATVRHLPEGWKQIPSNWYENIAVIDLFSNVELLPGVAKKHQIYDLASIRHQLSTTTDLVTRFVLIYLIPFFFAPAWLYRLYIKATAWCYFWLIYIIQLSRKASPIWATAHYKNRLRLIVNVIAVCLGMGAFVRFWGLSDELFLGWAPEGTQLGLQFVLGLLPLQTLNIWNISLLLLALSSGVLIWISADVAHAVEMEQKQQSNYHLPDSTQIWLGFWHKARVISVFFLITAIILSYSLSHPPVLLSDSLEKLNPAVLATLYDWLGMPPSP